MATPQYQQSPQSQTTEPRSDTPQTSPLTLPVQDLTSGVSQAGALTLQQTMGNQAVQELTRTTGEAATPTATAAVDDRPFEQRYADWLNQRIEEVDKLPPDEQEAAARSLLLQTVQVGSRMQSGEQIDLATLAKSPSLLEHGVKDPKDLPDEWIFATQRLIGRTSDGVKGIKFKEIAVDVPWYGQYTEGQGHKVGDTACFDTARVMVKDGGAGATVTDSNNRIQVGKSEDSTGHLDQIDPAAAEKGVNTINAELSADHGVSVGVSHSDRDTGNVDGLTDHFVVIRSRKTDENGRVTYTYNEPGTRSESKSTGTMTIDKDGRLVKEGTVGARYVTDRPYEVSMVRPNAP